ncbi:MAG: hypothetical protein AVO38_04130 [delta proteobacterium ML8_D]|nr:MAG: hypothetical protein AVO38_04130 [delta proteobacterium ML8_D]
MLEEQSFIPYSTSDIPSGPYLVFAPHPDDETFGMGGTIARATRAGIAVYVVVLTDGQQAGDAGTRRHEAKEAGKILGLMDIYFWGLPDRELHRITDTESRLHAVLESVKPKVVFLPAPQEFHPDHRAASYMFWEALKKLDFPGELWLYEITRQGEVNRLVDVTPVIPRKIEAIRCYSSQINQNNYEAVALSLNTARSYTLGPEVTHAEGFWQAERWKAKRPFAAYMHLVQRYRYGFMPSAHPLVSIVVRTKDRPQLLKEALESIAAQTYSPVEIIVVNDGGEDVSSLVDSFGPTFKNIKFIRNPESRGRAAAANQGLKAAEGNWIGFLDDDDVLEPSGVGNLIACALERDAGVVYGQVLREHYLSDGTRDPEREDCLYDSAFDRNRLLVGNYIPFNAFLFKREVLIRCGPIAEDLSLYEDWDLLLRLAADHEFLYVPVLVAHYRCFGTSTAEGTRFSVEESMSAENIVRERWCSRLGPEIVKTFRRYIDRVKTDLVFGRQSRDKKSSMYGLMSDLEETENERRLLQKTVESVTGERDFWQAQVRLMETSISWRITRPLRWLRAFQRRRTKPPFAESTSLTSMESRGKQDL